VRITYTKHALNKKGLLKQLGWDISLNLIENMLLYPKLSGKTKQNQSTAISFLDKLHFLRVVYEKRNDIILVITFHVSRKGRYNT